MSSRSKLLWRCRRGVKELDVVLTRYLETSYDASTDAEKQTFEYLLEFQDPEILRFLLNQATPEDEKTARLIEKIRK